MKRSSFRVFFSVHEDGCRTGVLLRTWDWIFDRPPPMAYGTTEQSVCDALESTLLATVAAGHDFLDRYLWDESFLVKTIRLDVHPQAAVRGAFVVGIRTIPIEMTYLASRVPGGYRILVPRFNWRFIIEDLSVAPDVLRQAVSADLLGESARWIYELHKSGLEYVHPFEPRSSPSVREQADSDELRTVRSVSEDLVELALRRKLVPPVGVDSRLSVIEPLVSRTPPASLLIIGPPGVGKSTFVTRLAFEWARNKRQNREVPRLWSTSADRILAGMTYLGMWQKRCLDLLGELAYERDYLHVGRLVDVLREQPDGDSIGEMLVEPIRDGAISVIAEATEEELEAANRRAPTVVSAFEHVRLTPPSTVELCDWMADYQRRRGRGVELHGTAMLRLVHHLDVLRPDVAFPGKAIRFIDWLERTSAPAGSRSKVLYPRDVSEALSRYTGLPLSLISDDVPASAEEMAAQLGTAVIGQPQACATAARVLARFKAGLNDPERPCGTLLFTGPTGVGKTELAKQLARTMFGDESRMVRVDMSEYMLPGSAFRLLDAQEGTLSLARQVRQQPLSLVLLDEIEKAHPEVFDLLLSILGEGRLSDDEGRLVDFRMALIVMTSNLGSGGPREVGFELASEVRPGAERAVRSFFRPELFNRIDHVVGFRPLRLDDVERIVDLEVQRAANRPGFARRKLVLRVTPEARRRIASMGFRPDQGARPLKRIFEAHVIAPVAARIAEDPAFGHCTVTVELREGQIRLT